MMNTSYKIPIFLLIFTSRLSAPAQSEWPVPNVLNLNWPGELVYFESTGSADASAASFELNGVHTPVQVETDGDVTRYWSFVSVPKRGKGVDGFMARLSDQAAPAGIAMREEGDFYIIENGVYQFRLRKGEGELSEPVPLADLPHWIGGMRLRDGQDWDGRAWFEGRAQVEAVRTTLIAQGPVFIDFHIEVEFAGEPESGTAEALPLESGKQSYLWPPNEYPVEEIPKRTHYYEAKVRFVMDDPWIDVNERFHFPRDPDYEPWGISQYWIQWGDAADAPDVPGFDAGEGMNVDTVTWVRWFLYDQFGGNTRQHYVPARPREDQKGRPFALLRPRWNQGGGGAQDFFVTSGGEPSSHKQERDPETNQMTRVEVPGGVGYDPENMAAGLVAAFPSKWVGPYPATIAAYALDENRAAARFPMIDGERSGRHYGQRAYGLCVGPRRLFTNLNDLVRRHTDWTLVAELNKYILDWDRGGEVASMNLPDAGLFIQRRYQDDFLNPTQRATRNLTRLGTARRELGPDKPMGGPLQAALGYIFTDLDHWPGWHNGWLPGNPNFHTDKYMGAVYTASALPEHPHAGEWLEFGSRNLEEDLSKAIVGSDGVGVECPGYSGYSLMHQLDIMRTLRDNGETEIFRETDNVKASGHWHRKLLTPPDFRIGFRHEAPHGDTHRWSSGLSGGFGKLAFLYQDTDPAFAAEMLGTLQLLKDSGDSYKYLKLDDWLQGGEIKVEPADPEQMDWSSQTFEGFGAVFRDGFGTEGESFLSFKAGFTSGHYHNDDLAYHFYSGGVPVSLDYNCSYTPRGDHAALHNSMTFGNSGHLRNNQDNRQIEAMEQLFSRAEVQAFTGTEIADLVVAERRSNSLTLSPVYPEDHEFNRSYPGRETDPIVHRRTLVMVKHADGSAAPDYLVVRDETLSTEPQQLNVHLLAREVNTRGHRVTATGQWGGDIEAAFFPMSGEEKPRIEERAWYYSDQWMLSPGEPYARLPGEEDGDWAARIGKRDRIPESGWKPGYKKGKGDPAGSEWQTRIEETDGKALIPPPGWSREVPWRYGEYQIWLRVHSSPGQDMVWVLYPVKPGEPAPELRFDAASGVLRVGYRGGEDVFDFTEGLEVSVAGRTETLLAPGELPVLEE